LFQLALHVGQLALHVLDRARGEQCGSLAFDGIALSSQIAQFAFVLARFFEQLEALLLELRSPSFKLFDVGGTEREKMM
jgi:hypothetical protein